MFAWLTMEEVFIITWTGAIIGGVLLGFGTYWLFNGVLKDEDGSNFEG